MCFKKPHTHTPEIQGMWAGINVSSMGNQGVQLLLARTTTFWNLDRPEATGRNSIKGSNNLDNPGLTRFREKIMSYNFTVTWVPRKTHYIADTLSGAPIFYGWRAGRRPKGHGRYNILPQNIQQPSAQNNVRSSRIERLRKSCSRAAEDRETHNSRRELSSLQVP